MQLSLAACSQRGAGSSNARCGTSKLRWIARPGALGRQQNDYGSGRQHPPGSQPSAASTNAPQQRIGPVPSPAAPATQCQPVTAPSSSSVDNKCADNPQVATIKDQSDGRQHLINFAADQQEQAEATSSSLRTMIQKMIDAQNMLRHWRGGAGAGVGTSINGTISPSSNGRSSPAGGRASPGSGRSTPGSSSIRTPPPSPIEESSTADKESAAAVQQALQPELHATKAKLSRALSALTKLQAAYQQQQATVRRLEQQLQEYASSKQADAPTTSSSATSKLPGLVSALAMVAGAGAASTRLSGQQQELRNQLVAAENIERLLKSELEAKGEQLQTLKQQVAVELNELQGVITQQAAQLAQMTQLLEDNQTQLTATRTAQAVLQAQLQQKEADYAAQAVELESLAAALSAAQGAASNMRWELLTKEASLSALSKQLADAEDTAQRAAAAQADLLQQKEATIAALLEKLELQEAAAAAEAVWADGQLQSSKAESQELRGQLDSLQTQLQQQQAESDQAYLFGQQQQLGVGEATQQRQEVSSTVLAQLRGALLSNLAQQLQALNEAHVQQLQQLQAPANDRPVAYLPAEAVDLPAVRWQQDTDNSSRSNEFVGVGPAAEELVAKLQNLLGDNTHLAEQLSAVLGAAEEQRKQQGLLIAAKDQQLAQQAELLQHAEQKLDDQTARLTAALDAAQAATQHQQEDRMQLQQMLQQHDHQLQQQPHLNRSIQPGQEQQQQQLERLEKNVSVMLQDVQDAMLQLHQEGAWAFPTAQGVVDLSIPQLVQQYQQMMQDHLKGGNLQQQNSQASTTAGADAFVEAFFQVKDRDKALHTLQAQLIVVQQHLSELLALQEVSTTAAQQGGTSVDAASGISPGAVQQLEARIEKLRDNNCRLSESLTLSRKQKAVAEAEGAAAKQHADMLLQQLLDAEPSVAAAAQAVSNQLQQELEDTRADLAETLQQLKHSAASEADAIEQVAELEGKLAVAIVRREAAAVEKAELQRRLAADNLELQHRLAAAEAAAAAGKLVLEHRLAAAEAAAAHACSVQEQQREQLWSLQQRLQQQQEGVQNAAVLPFGQQEVDRSATDSADTSVNDVSSSSSTDSSTDGSDTLQDVTINMGDININMQEQPLQAAKDMAATSWDDSPLAAAAAAFDDSVYDIGRAVPSDVTSSVNMISPSAQPELQDALQLLRQVKQQLEQRDKMITQLQQRLAESRSARQHRKQELEAQLVDMQDKLVVQSTDIVAGSAQIAATAADSELEATAPAAVTTEVDTVADQYPVAAVPSNEGLEAARAPAAVSTPVDAVAATAATSAAVVPNAAAAMPTHDMEVTEPGATTADSAALHENYAEGVTATDVTLDEVLPQTEAVTADTDQPEAIAAVAAAEVAQAVHGMGMQAVLTPDVMELLTAEPAVVDAAACSDVSPAAPEPVTPPPAPSAVAHAAAVAATAGMGSSSSRAELMGSGLSMALMVPLVSQLLSAQQSEAQLLAAKSKVCQVLGLVASTEAALVQTQDQVLALQQRLWEVSGWRPLLTVAWRLQDAEDSLAADVAALQKLEEQQQQQQDEEQDTHKEAAAIGEQTSHSDHQEQQQQENSEYSTILADMVGWQGPAAAAAALEKSRGKVGELLAHLAERQLELARLQRHMQRLAAILMAGVDDEMLGQLQKRFEVQLEQLERSRLSVAHQLQELRQQQQQRAEPSSGAPETDS